MTKPVALLKLAACSLLWICAPAAWGAVAYNNADPAKFQNLFYDAGTEFGNEIRMAPGDPTLVSQFQVDYYLASASAAGKTITLRFYANDAPYGPGTVIKAPGTLLFDSGPLPIHTGYETMTIDRLALSLPDSFTWTATFGGLGPSDQAGLLIYGPPPSVGSVYNDFWQKTGTTWDLKVLPGVPSTFGALIFKGALAPPTIVTGPSNQVVAVGSTVTFKVVANGTIPLAYQWLLNAAPLPGQTGANLTFTGVQASQVGQYSVIVSNTVGTATSDPALLTVDFPVTLLQAPGNQTVIEGENASFAVEARGTLPISYQWLVNGVALKGADQPQLTLSQVRSNQSGLYTVRATNSVSSVTSAPPAVLTVIVPATITQPVNTPSVKVGANVTLSVGAVGTEPLGYQWSFGGSLIPGATSASLGLSKVPLTSNGVYSVLVSNGAGTATSNGRLTVGDLPVIKTQPAGTRRGVAAGSRVDLAVAATGSPVLNYQWLLNGAPLAGAAANLLTLNNIQSADSGNYQVVVTNLVGGVTSQVAVVTANTPARITVPPSSQLVLGGTTVVFQVVATGTAPITYQWKKDGVDIPDSAQASSPFGNLAGLGLSLPGNSFFNAQNPVANASGQTTATLVITNVSRLSNAGKYSVYVSNGTGNGLGGELSADALLTVNEPVRISLQPQDAPVKAGQDVYFNALLIGDPPITWQWQFNGVDLPGETNKNLAVGSTLKLRTVSKANEGNYRLLATNQFGNVISRDAALIIATQPVVSALPPTTNAEARSTVTLSVTATGTPPLQYQWLLNGANITANTAPNIVSGSWRTASLVFNNVQPNNMGAYSVTVANAGGTVTSGTTTLVLQLAALSLADNIADIPAPYTQAAGNFSGSNAGASKENSEPRHLPGRPPQKSVWIGWQAPASGVVTFDTLGSAFDTVLTAYTGANAAGLNLITYNDDTPGTLQSQVRFSAVQGTVYKIVVDGFENASGYFVLNWNLNVTPYKLPAIKSHPLSARDYINLTGIAQAGTTTFNHKLAVAADTTGIANVIYRWRFYSGLLTGTGTSGSSLDNVTSITTEVKGNYGSGGSFPEIKNTSVVSLK